MRALLCKAYGPPDQLVLEEVAPLSPGPGQVVIRVKACGVNFPDTLIIQGQYQFKPPMPFAPGAEVAAHRHSGGTVTTQVSGSHAFTVLEGAARLVVAGTATPTAGEDAGEPMVLGQEYLIAPGDVMIFDEMVVHTAHNPTTEPAVLMEAQLRASDRPLTEFIPELATPVG